MNKGNKKENKHKYIDFVLQKTSGSYQSGNSSNSASKQKDAFLPLAIAFGIFRFLKNLFVLARLAYYELLYFSHLRVRHIHDHLYQKNDTYKRVNDYKYTRPIRRATILAFVCSFILFQVLGNLWPEVFNPARPQVAKGAATTVTWTSQGDFESNDISKGSNIWDTTRSGLDTSTAPGFLKLSTQPIVFNVQPAGNITNSSATLSAQYSSSSGINTSLVTLKLDGVTQSGCTVTASQVSCSVTGLVSGSHSVIVNVTDNQGSTASGAATFTAPLNLTTTPNIFSNGANCTTIGTWNSTTHTCTLAYDIITTAPNGISVGNSGVTIDGAGHTITAVTRSNNTGVADLLNNNVTIKNLNIVNFGAGVFFQGSSGGTISSNTFSGDTYGVELTSQTNSAVYNNSFINSATANYNISGGSGNTFNQGSPTGGNYYSNYSTSAQGCSDANADGFCDAAYNFTGGADTYPWTAQNGWLPQVSNIQPSGNVSSSSATVSASYQATGGSSINTSSVAVQVDGTTLTGCTVTATSVSCPAAGLAGGVTHVITGSVASANGNTAYFSGSFIVNLNSYNTAGTLGGSGSTDVGLRMDAGPGTKAKWSNIDFSLNGALANSQGLKFLIRTSDDGSTWTIYDSGGNVVAPANMETAFSSAYYGQINGGQNNDAVSANVPASRYADIIVRLISDGSATPQVDSVTLGYNSLEAPTNSSLVLTKTTGASLKTGNGLTLGAGAAGGWTNETSVNLTANGLTCTGCGTSTNMRPQVEIKPVGSAFDGTTNLFMAAQGSTTASITGLAAGTAYHMQVRSIDDQGRVSAWTSYGGNSDGSPPGIPADADLTIDQTAPPAVTTLSSSNPVKTVALNWTTVADGASGTSYYNVYRSSASGTLGVKVSADGAVTTGTFSESPTDGTYYYTVQAVDNAGNEQAVGSNQIAVIVDNVAPASFTLASPISGTWQQSSTPTFSWNASSDANGLAKYQLFVDGVLSKDNIPSASTSAVPGSGLSAGTHSWYVKAIDNAGNSTQSTGTFTIGYDITAPSLASDPSFTLTATNINTTSITVSWGAYADTGDTAPVDHYSLERLKYSDYTNGNHTLTSDWSLGGDGLGSGYYNIGDKADTVHSQVDMIGANPDNVDASVKYIYRIKVIDKAGNVSAWLLTATGMTSDVQAPTEPSAVTAAACDGSTGNCSNIANKGFEIKLAWTASSDSGTGVTGYKIYRASSDSNNASDYALIGYLDVATPGAPVNTVYYDNDTNNDTTYSDTISDVTTTIKGAATPHLNDYVSYYYRVVAIDAAGNATNLITHDNDLLQTPNHTNFASTRTPDITAPTVPQNVVATPMGLDSSGTAQRVDISWSASSDISSRDANVNGSGISGYMVLQCQGDSTACSNDANYSQIATTTSTNLTKEGLSEFTSYFYKIIAVDKASSSTITDTGNNSSARSSSSSVTTASNTVPTVPTSVSVTTKTGDPASTSDVGHQNTVTFSGSYAKNCSGGVRCIVGYEIYRSTDNFAANSLEIADVSVSPVQDERNVTYTYVDNNTSNDSTAPSIARSIGISPTVAKSQTPRLNDATTYYYKVKAKDNTPANPDGGPFTSGLSAITTGALHAGWDATPDATAPDVPQDVAVKDIHPNDSMVRNIVTWTMVADSMRNAAQNTNWASSASDFAKYQVYRYETLLGPGTASLIAEETDRGDNYYVDGIPNANKDKNYSYYVVSVDNAGTAFKYSNGSLINGISNVSGYLPAVSINPGSVDPTVSDIQVASAGVSSATINWTTDQNTDSLVEYRVKGSGDVVAAGRDRTQPTTNHSVGLNSLDKGTAYEYRIVSRNSLGNIDSTAANTWRDFSTKDFAISSIGASTTTTTATITWDTNIASDSYVEYKPEHIAGQNDEDSQVAGDSTLATTHSVSIKSLIPDRTYTYKIRSVTSDQYIAETSFQTFKTRVNDLNQFSIAPAETSVSEQNVTATTAQITWVTATATTSWVDYGTESDVYSMSAGDDDYNTLHAVKLTNLRPGTKYYYRVKGKDENLIEFFSPESSFTAVLMPEISNLRVAEFSPYMATITFDTNVDTVVSVNYGKDTGYGASVTVTKAEKNHVVTLKDLDDNSTYHLQASATDQFKNNVESADLTFSTPLDTQGPEVSELKVDVLPIGDSTDTASVIISWTTDKPSTTQVEYDDKGAGEKYDNHSIENTTLSTTHTVLIKDLSTSSNYRFRVISKDKRGNITKTKASTFITPTKEKSLIQVIIKSFEDTFSWTRNIPAVMGKIGNRLLGR